MVNLYEEEARQKQSMYHHIKEDINAASDRAIDILPNGNRLVHDLSRGYIVDGATNEVKGYCVRDGAVGGEGKWIDAEIQWNRVVGPGSCDRLSPKRSLVFG